MGKTSLLLNSMVWKASGWLYTVCSEGLLIKDHPIGGTGGRVLNPSSSVTLEEEEVQLSLILFFPPWRKSKRKCLSAHKKGFLKFFFFFCHCYIVWQLQCVSLSFNWHYIYTVKRRILSLWAVSSLSQAWNCCFKIALKKPQPLFIMIVPLRH